MRKKTCTRCKKAKPLSEFYRNAKGREGHLSRCKECIRFLVYGHQKRKKFAKKVNEDRREHQERLKAIRESLPKGHKRTCGFYNPNDRVVWSQQDLENVCNMWAQAIETARNGITGGGNGNNIPPNPHFFTDKHGVYKWLCDHMGVDL